jgi:hypothetical protein
MFNAIVIDKDDSGYRANLQQVNEEQLPEGDVTVAGDRPGGHRGSQFPPRL